MKPFNDYDKITVGEYKDLPNGAYVMIILNVELCHNSTGEYLKLGCDIADGEQKGFFAEDYNGQQREDKKWHCHYLVNIPKDDGTEKDGWTKKKFKRFITAVEESNEGYTWGWDENTLKGKLVGGIFNHREYEKNDGSIGKAVSMAGTCSVEAVKNGTFKPIEDKLIARPATRSTDTSWMDVGAVDDEELPFN